MRVVRSSGDAIEGAGIGHSAVPLMFTAVFHHNCCSDDLRALCVPSAAPSPRGATPSTSVDYFCAVSVPPVDPPVSAPSSTTTTTNNNNTTNTPKHQRTTVDPSFNEENFFRNPEAHPSRGEIPYRKQKKRTPSPLRRGRSASPDGEAPMAAPALPRCSPCAERQGTIQAAVYTASG